MRILGFSLFVLEEFVQNIQVQWKHGKHASNTLCKAKSTEKLGSYKSASAVRLANIAKTHHNSKSSRNQEDNGSEKNFSIRFSKKESYLWLRSQRHWVVDKSERIKVHTKCDQSRILCPRIRATSLEFSRTCRCRNKVRNLQQQARGEMKLHRAENNKKIPHHERTSCIPMYLPIGKGSGQVQTWKRDCSLQWRFEYSWSVDEDYSGRESANNPPHCLDLVKPIAEDASGWAWFRFQLICRWCYDVNAAWYPWLGWQTRASVMRPTAYQNFKDWEKFQENLGSLWESQRDKQMWRNRTFYQKCW